MNIDKYVRPRTIGEELERQRRIAKRVSVGLGVLFMAGRLAFAALVVYVLLRLAGVV